MLKGYIGIGVIGVLVIAALVYQYSSLPAKVDGTLEPTATDGDYVITLTEDGFVPDELTLRVGDTVVFNTTTGNMFWPASNLHPSHLIYPEFDPQGPVQPDDTWGFTFTEAGEWKFHDHLAPYFTGVLTVTE